MNIFNTLNKTLLASLIVFTPAVGTVATIGTLAATTTPAYAALNLDSAKQQGLVGERPDGLLGIVGDTVTGEVKALVDDVNKRRMELFRKIAADKKQPVETVQKVSGQEFIARTPAGQYIMNSSGKWEKK